MEASESEIFNMTVLVTITLAILTAILYFIKGDKNRKHLPPGPKPYPVIGNALQVGRQPHVSFMKFAEIYGPVVYLQMGSENWVVLSDVELIREMFNKSVASGRANDNPILYEMSRGHGIGSSEGELWEAQRRFTLKTLKDFGFAKAGLEGCIMEDVNITMNWLKQRKDLSISGLRIFNAPVGNTLWNIVSGKKCDWINGTTDFLKLGGDMVDAVAQMCANGLVFVPFLRHIMPETLGFTKWSRAIRLLKEMCEECIDEHTFKSSENISRDFIDHYIEEIQNTADPNSSFYKDEGRQNLVSCLLDLFMAGQETTSTSLSWALLFMSRNPSVQSKVQEEIENVIGPSETPSLSHRKNMPYVEAVLCEILRLGSPLPLAIPHRLMADTEFHGYKLKKGTVVVSNIYGIHHDPKLWKDAETFRPERFLNEDGTQIVKYTAFMPFGEGKRKCLGETLARDSLFLYFTRIFQQFNVAQGKDPEKSELLKENAGFVLSPKPFNIVFSERKASNKEK